MSSRKAMDIFGEALAAYSEGDRAPFYLKDEDSKKHVYSLADRFRPYSRLNNSEKKLLSLCKGDILYVGCGTGNLVPFLEKRGNVLGIDISPKVIEVAGARGCDNCKVADVFKFKTGRGFDTIALFGNDLGIGGTVSKTKELLQALKKLLKVDGQILAIIRNYDATDYKQMTLTPIWRNKVGPKFNWILFDTDFLARLCDEENLKLKLISSSWKYKLLRITK